MGQKQWGPQVTGAVPGAKVSGGLIKLLNRLITELKAKRAMGHGPRMTEGHLSGCPHQALYGSCPHSHQRHSAVSHLPQVRPCCPSVGPHAGPGGEAGAGRPGTDSPLPASRGPGTRGGWGSARPRRRPAP